MSKEIVRRMSVGENMMSYKVDDLLYGFMRCFSTAEPVLDENGKQVMTDNGKPEYREYLPKKTFSKKKKAIAAMLNCVPNTVKNHLDVLLKRGLVTEDDNNYYFPHDYNYPYKDVEKDLLEYLLNTRNAHCIKIYLYLRNKYEWKKKDNEDYIFTQKELRISALGYAATNKDHDSMVKDILDSFIREGMIEVEYFSVYDYESENTTPRIRLKKLVTSKSELPKTSLNK